MKLFLKIILIILSGLLISFSLYAGDLYISTSASQPSFSRFMAFIYNNWELTALCISEVAAFVPVPFNGILHTVVRFGNLLHKKSSKHLKIF